MALAVAPAGRYRLSPHCVFVPDPDGRSIVITHSVYGSRFKLDARFLAALLSDDRVARSKLAKKSPAAWTSAVKELVREKVLIDGRSHHRMTRRMPFSNGMGALELAVLRGVNEGGVKRITVGPPPGATKPAGSGRGVSLTTHVPAADVKDLADGLAARQSIRTYSSRPLARRDLEQFFQLTVRAYASIESPDLGPTSLRNYPSGGARYPLEVYPVVLNVQGLAQGFYRYHPFHHRLEFLGRKARYLDALRQAARHRMGRSAEDVSEPAVLLVVTAVFARTCWKYEGIPFQLILQETGALYQTMYLAATALRLAPCAVGAFPERAVGEILGLDPGAEAQVGLFALGVRSEASGAGSPLRIERFTVRAGSPFWPGRSRYSVELAFAGGEKETIDARDFTVKRFGETFACDVRRGRQCAIFEGRALVAIKRRVTQRNGITRLRIGRESVVVGATSGR